LRTHRLAHLKEEVLQQDFMKGVKFSERNRYHKFEQQADGYYACVKPDGSKLVVDGIITEQASF